MTAGRLQFDGRTPSERGGRLHACWHVSEAERRRLSSQASRSRQTDCAVRAFSAFRSCFSAIGPLVLMHLATAPHAMVVVCLCRIQHNVLATIVSLQRERCELHDTRSARYSVINIRFLRNGSVPQDSDPPPVPVPVWENGTDRFVGIILRTNAYLKRIRAYRRISAYRNSRIGCIAL